MPNAHDKNCLQLKICIYFVIIHKNEYCGYSLVAPQRDAYIENPEHMFSKNIKRISYLIFALPGVVMLQYPRGFLRNCLVLQKN